MNSILVIHPYKTDGVWAFDDPDVGLVQEPFVSGADKVIEQLVESLPDAENGFALLFSETPFPGFQAAFEWRRRRWAGTGTTAHPMKWKVGCAPRSSSISITHQNAFISRSSPDRSELLGESARPGTRFPGKIAASPGGTVRRAPVDQESSMLHVVVMAGGSGTRFWPKSRRNRPKQLLNLAGDGTMIQQTVWRIGDLAPPERVWVITGADQAQAVREQLPDVPPKNVVAEPCPRDTAPCVGLAAAMIARGRPRRRHGRHAGRPHHRPRRDLPEDDRRRRRAPCEDDPTAFVTLGVKPTRAETGYGYIERGESLGLRDGIAMHRVAQFREKPDRATAERFLADGRFAWNAGIFVWKARAILDAIAEFCPGLSATARPDRPIARHRPPRPRRSPTSSPGWSASRSTRPSWRRPPTSASWR